MCGKGWVMCAKEWVGMGHVCQGVGRSGSCVGHSICFFIYQLKKNLIFHIYLSCIPNN